MTAYFDASAIGAIILNEAKADHVVAVVAEFDASVMVTEFGIAEVSSAISRLLRMRYHDIEAATARIEDLDRWTEITADLVDVETEDFVDATDLVRHFELKLRASDALHLAIARRLDAHLITLDERLATAAVAIGLAVINPAFRV